MAFIEKTQFSMVEYNLFLKDPEGAPIARTGYLELLKQDLTTNPNALAHLGGIDNIQRVRVLTDGDKVKFDFVAKLPPTILAEKKRQAEREEKRQKVLAELEVLKSNPVAYRNFIKEVAFQILGRAALELLEASKHVKGASRKPHSATRKAPPKKQSAFDKALAQDRRNRIEAAKKAAEAYKAKKDEEKAA
jgi:hypothetical protein